MSAPPLRSLWRIFFALIAALLAFAAWVVVMNRHGEVDSSRAFTPTPALVERGAYLARAGNCMACHSARGGTPYAGGRPLATPFGTVFASNLTPDVATGLGGWTAAQFWRAMHHGQSADGRLLYPAFPYPNYTEMTRDDSDAVFAYLQSLPPVEQPTPAHELRFPFNTQAALAVWRALFFRPAQHQPQPQQSAEWNRGAYLVRSLGHCSACHAPRNAFGAAGNSLDLGGGLIPMQHWYAPSLAAPHEAGVADWEIAEIVALLRDGVSPRGSVLGPMAEVVFRSTQYLNEADLRAMAVYLKALPQAAAPAPATGPAREPAQMERGARLYEQHCVACHGAAGQGAAGAYPPLAGNRAVTLDTTVNLIQVVLQGGYAPATAGNPRPYGMPPYAHLLGNQDIADLLTYLRGSWGNDAAPVTQLQVLQLREGRPR